MIKSLKLKFESEFTRNVLTLMTGTALAQALPIAVSPILTRLYTPEDFGLLALFVAIFSIISAISTGRYEVAIMAPATHAESQNVVFLSIVVAVVTFVLSTLLIWFFNQQMTELLGNPKIGNWLYFVPITVLCFGVYQSIDYWLNRHRRYKNMSINKLSQAGSVGFFQVSIGVFNSAGLLIGSVLGWTLSVLIIVKRSKLQFSQFNIQSVIAVAIKYKNYPLLQAPSSLLNSISAHAPIFFATKYYDSVFVGYLSLVIKVMSAPASLISRSIGQVFFQRVSDHAKTAPDLLLKDLYQVAIKLSVIALVVFTPVLIFGSEIFAFVFGTEWTEAGAFAQILVFSIAIQFVVSPLSSILLAIGKIKVCSLWQLLYFITTLSVLFFAIKFDPIIFMWIYVAKELVMYTLYFLLMVYSVKSFVMDSLSN